MYMYIPAGRDVQAIVEILKEVDDWTTLTGWLNVRSETIEENCIRTSVTVAECRRTAMVWTCCYREPSGDPSKVASAIADVLESKMDKKYQANRIRALTFSRESSCITVCVVYVILVRGEGNEINLGNKLH